MNRRKFLNTAAGAFAASTLASPAIVFARSSTIVELAAGTPNLSTLVAAVQAAGLVDTLSAPGNFTVFAPTNAAFEALPAGTVETLLRAENRDQLTAILTYHVSSDFYPASALLGKRGRVPTVNGAFISVDATGSAVHLNRNTRVITPDVRASNGVVHIIDRVLTPH